MQIDLCIWPVADMLSYIGIDKLNTGPDNSDACRRQVRPNKRMQSDFGELALPSAADAKRYAPSIFL